MDLLNLGPSAGSGSNSRSNGTVFGDTGLLNLSTPAPNASSDLLQDLLNAPSASPFVSNTANAAPTRPTGEPFFTLDPFDPLGGPSGGQGNPTLTASASYSNFGAVSSSGPSPSKTSAAAENLLGNWDSLLTANPTSSIPVRPTPSHMPRISSTPNLEATKSKDPLADLANLTGISTASSSSSGPTWGAPLNMKPTPPGSFMNNIPGICLSSKMLQGPV